MYLMTLHKSLEETNRGSDSRAVNRGSVYRALLMYLRGATVIVEHLLTYLLIGLQDKTSVYFSVAAKKLD